MENTKEDKEVHIKEHISKVVRETLGLPKETPTGSMTTINPSVSIIWRPNNYRRQTRIKNTPNSGDIALLPKANQNLHNKLISIKHYQPNITIQIGKGTITGIYSQNKIGKFKETYHIEANIEEELETRINQKKEEIRQRIDKAILDISNDLKTGLEGNIRWSRHEDFIKGEEYIDKIPREVIIHDTVFKKVYGKGIEFFGGDAKEPTVSLKNYIKSRIKEDWFEKEITPNIVNSINEMGIILYEQQNQWFQKYEKHLESHTNFVIGASATMKTTLSILKKLDKRLSQTKLREWL